MGGDASNTPLNSDEVFMHQKLHFATSLQDLKNLRQQLYSAAEYFEVSYENDDQKQSVIETSKDYVSKAVVSTVDHLGSIADKLNKFLDDNTLKFSATNTRFYCIQQRLNTFQELVDLRGMSLYSLPFEAPKNHNKLYNSPGVPVSCFRKSNLVYKDCVPDSPNNLNQSNQDNPFTKGFHLPVIKPQPPTTGNSVGSRRKGELRSFSCEHPRGPVDFSFTRAQSNKESVKHSESPSHFTLRRSGTVSYRPLSPSSSVKKYKLCPSFRLKIKVLFSKNLPTCV